MRLIALFWLGCKSILVGWLIDSKNPTDYIRKMKKRDAALS